MYIPVNIEFTPDERGYYLIELQDGNEEGDVASFFIGAYPWGDSPSTGKDEGTLVLKSDKQNYNPGEEALVSFPVPNSGTILYSFPLALPAISAVLAALAVFIKKDKKTKEDKQEK